MNARQITQLLDKHVSYKNHVFHVNSLYGGDEPIFLYSRFIAKDSHTGLREVQQTRKWPINSDMSESEIVQTALKCVITAEEHEARENFKYKGKAIFGPHYDIEDLHSICEG